MQPRGFRPAVPRRDADSDVFGGRLRVFHEDVEVAVLAESAGINQFVFGILTRALCILADEFVVGKWHLRIFVQELQIGTRRSGVEIVVILFYVLTVIPFAIREPEKPLLQDRVLFVPERESETDALVAIADAADSVLSPAIGARTRMIVRQIVPRVAVRAVVLADRAPLPLGKIWPPALPVNFPVVAGLQPLYFGRHSLVPYGRRCGIGAGRIQELSRQAQFTLAV